MSDCLVVNVDRETEARLDVSSIRSYRARIGAFDVPVVFDLGLERYRLPMDALVNSDGIPHNCHCGGNEGACKHLNTELVKSPKDYKCNVFKSLRTNCPAKLMERYQDDKENS